MIAVKDLKKSYAAFQALKGISFEVPRGTVTGFLGPNGAGKTTTLRILSGFMPASEGTVEVAGFNVNTHSREVRRRVGYLPEDVPLYRDMTVEAFLEYMGGLKEIPRTRLRSEVDRVVKKTGLGAVKKRLIYKISRGYRQRTGVAMALLGDPPVLLLDEPTSGLDPNQVIEVRELIRDLSGERTVLLSSHILSEVAQICSQVLIINQGKLVASGTPEELSERLGPGQGLLLRVAGTLDPGLLENVPGVLGVTRGPAAGEWRLTVDHGDTVAPLVSRAILEHGGELLELHQETSDLEGVFRAVTREGDGDA